MDRPFSAARIALGCLLGVAIAGLAQAQKTWIVDRLGAGDFRTVTAAVTAASQGDTILVLAGAYPEIVSTTKGLRLIGIGKPTIDGIRVDSLVANSHFVIKGVRCPDQGQGISLTHNQGAVHLEDVSIPAFFIQLGIVPPLNIQDSSLVSVTGCDFAGYTGASISNSTVYIVDSVLRGSDGYVTFMHNSPAQPGLMTSKSTVVLAGTSCTGGQGTQQMMVYNAPAAGIRMYTSEIFVMGDDTTAISAGGVVAGNTFSSPAIYCALGGTLYLDPRVKLSATNTSQTIQGTVAVQATMPTLLATQQTTPVALVKTEVRAPQGWVSALFAGLPGRGQPWLPHGYLWLDPGAPLVLLDVGQLGLSGSRTYNLVIPATVPRGEPVTFQALVMTPTSTLLLSNGVTVVLN